MLGCSGPFCSETVAVVVVVVVMVVVASVAAVYNGHPENCSPAMLYINVYTSALVVVSPLSSDLVYSTLNPNPRHSVKAANKKLEIANLD